MIKLDNIHLEFDRILLEKENMNIPYGKITGIIGKSGSGKTTLLQEIALLGKCKCMCYYFDDYTINDLSNFMKNEICRKDISFIFQDVYLFSHLNIKENILFYLSLVNKKLSEDEIMDLLDFVDLSVDIHSDIHTLSGGEQQRLAIVCGLVKDAKLFIFDEPTAYLDSQNKELIIKILQRLAYEKNKMVLIATHDSDLVSLCDRVYEIKQQHILLIKDCNYEITNVDDGKSVFSFKVLQKYIHLIFHKQYFLKICFVLFFSILLSLILVLQTYSQNYQQKNGQTLIETLNYQIVLSHKDNTPILPEEQAMVQYAMSDYTIYSDIKSYGQIKDNEVLLTYYLPHSKSGLQSLNSLQQSSSIQQKECDDIYISYSLYRNLLIAETQFQWKYNEKKFDIRYSHVLKPSESLQYTIYMSYSDYKKLMKSLDIDIGLLETYNLIIPIQSIEDIQNIQNQLSKEFKMTDKSDVLMRIQLTQIFNSYSIMGIISFALIVMMIYKIYQLYSEKKDMGLMRSLGVNNLNLIKMKLYEEMITLIPMFSLTIVISSIILMALQVFTLDGIVLIGMYACGVYSGFLLIVLACYSLILKIYTPIKLLK